MSIDFEDHIIDDVDGTYPSLEIKDNEAGRATFRMLKALDPTLNELVWSEVVGNFFVFHYPSFGTYSIVPPESLGPRATIRPGPELVIKYISSIGWRQEK